MLTLLNTAIVRALHVTMKVPVVSNEMRGDREPLEVVDSEGRVLVYTREELVGFFPYMPPITLAGAFQVRGEHHA